MVNIDTSEVRELAADFTREPPTKIPRVRRAVRKTGSDVERDMKIFCPVDTGFLENSISTSILRGGFAAEVGPTASYGHYVNDGTSKMAPQKYAEPALERNLPGFVAVLGQIAGDIL